MASEGEEVVEEVIHKDKQQAAGDPHCPSGKPVEIGDSMPCSKGLPPHLMKVNSVAIEIPHHRDGTHHL